MVRLPIKKGVGDFLADYGRDWGNAPKGATKRQAAEIGLETMIREYLMRENRAGAADFIFNDC